ncbi:hypothetical protein [Orgyia pseudotsugata single capsid nuclopolyhedrovirus]|nr:hypothetical protein [Orgyia pseudotsugata single capsid nuclopolyhedrovirus]
MASKRIVSRNPHTLLKICADTLLNTNLYLLHFNEFNRWLPHSLKKTLIHTLMSDVGRDVKNYTITIQNWLNITENQFVELLRCDKRVPLYDPADIHKLVWCDTDGECCHCAHRQNKQPTFRTTKLYAECAKCEYETVLTYAVHDLNTIIFDARNWCKRCLVVPLFTIDEYACKFCELINKYGDDTVQLMVLKYGYSRVQNLIY